MGQDDEWGKLTNPTQCEHTVKAYTGNFPVTYSCVRTCAVDYTWEFCETQKQEKY